MRVRSNAGRPNDVDPGRLREHLTRRALLMRGAGTGAALSAGAVLAACGGSSSNSSSAAGGGSSASASASSSATGSDTGSVGGVPASVVDELRSMLKLPTGKAAGEGLKLPIGFDGSLSGAGTVWGIPMVQGVQLALAHIKALGGPDYTLTALDTPVDNLTGAGTTNTRQFGSMGMPAVLTSQYGGGGAGGPFYERYKMWAIDSGGGEPQNLNKPFLYQGRMLWAVGSMPNLIKWQKLKRPNVKKVGVLTTLSADPTRLLYNTEMKALKDAGYEINPVFPLLTTVDFSTFLHALQRGNPDIIVFPNTFGVNNATVLKQAQEIGITAPIVSIDYDRAWAVNAPPSAITKYEFIFDFFDANNPPTQWGKLFVSEYQRLHKQFPDYYAANYYETTFLVWNLVRRIIAAGGDPSKPGDAYVNAFAQNPSFPSVYSATPGVPYGTSTFSKTGHQVINRPNSYGHGNPDGSGTVLATAIQTGQDFTLTAAGKAVPVAS
jgi:branched-chain amino acid transport system substrate-binding protein